MKKLLIIILIIVVLTGLILWKLVQRGEDTTPVGNETPVNLPIGGNREDVPVTEGRMHVVQKRGATTMVNDIRDDSDTVPISGSLTKSYEFAVPPTGESADFQFVYSETDSGFIIVLLKNPLGATRTRAEAVFLSRLGISEAEACRLTVSVRTVADVSDEYSGRELGLSFCQGSVTLK